MHELGFELGTRAAGGESQGAWFATAPDGTPVLLKWFPDETVADRYAVLLPALSELRTRGVPVPNYLHVIVDNGWTLTAQQILPGSSRDNPPPAAVDAMVGYIAAKAGIQGPLSAPNLLPWGAFMVHTLTRGEEGWCIHESLRDYSPRSTALLDRIEAVGSGAEPGWFPDDGLVHLDLHTDNVLISDDGTLTGIIDWEGACAGDHRFDLVAFAFDVDGHGQSIWEIVEAADIEPRVLRAYVAHLALKCTDWAIRHHPYDVERQLLRAEQIFDRCGV